MKKMILALLMLAPTAAWSWGGRGHDTICRTAVFLVKEPGLKEYLQQKPQMMGHVCNMPDFFWKSISGEVSSAGNPTHFIDPEVTGMEVPKIPLDYKKIVDDFTGKENLFKKDGSKIFHVPTEFGSVWWRADQFMRRIALMKADFAAAKPPANSKEEQNSELQYNKLVYQMVIDMGLMGHFVGDTSQPFHTTADYDGYAAGHGGIHAYFEDGIVGEFDGDLETRVLTEARKFTNASFLKPNSTVEKMKALSVISMQEIPKILKLDPVLKPSVVKKDLGMEIRTPAERMPTAIGYKRMNKMIVTDMARGATLLAHLWDQAYESAGRPQLKAYKSYKYPFTVDFVAPDYVPESAKTAPAKPSVAPGAPAVATPATPAAK
jgi:hypothetical protein